MRVLETSCFILNYNQNLNQGQCGLIWFHLYISRYFAENWNNPICWHHLRTILNKFHFLNKIAPTQNMRATIWILVMLLVDVDSFANLWKKNIICSLHNLRILNKTKKKVNRSTKRTLHAMIFTKKMKQKNKIRLVTWRTKPHMQNNDGL